MLRNDLSFDIGRDIENIIIIFLFSCLHRHCTKSHALLAIRIYFNFAQITKDIYGIFIHIKASNTVHGIENFSFLILSGIDLPQLFASGPLSCSSRVSSYRERAVDSCCCCYCCFQSYLR